MSNVIVKHLPYAADLDKPLKKTYVDTLLATEDNKAHSFDISLYLNNEPVPLPSGAAVSAYFIRGGDNATVSLTGKVSGNVASVTLNKSCYSKAGQFAIVIKVTSGDIIHTVFCGEGTIHASSSNTIVDGEHVIPSLSDLLAQIAAMEAATSAANTATGKVNTATTNANNAAAKINGMTVSAKSTTAPSAEVTEKNGVKHVTFGLVTPDITFQVATGPAGTDVEMEQSGTAEAPVVKLTIPRGDTGAIDGIDYYEGTPSALGTASPGTSNGVARGNHTHPMPTAAQVGALAVGGTAANSNKLGGHTLDELFPVGTILMFNSTTVSPAALYGGMWMRLYNGFMVGGGNKYPVGSTGGATSVKLTRNNIPPLSLTTETSSGTETGYSVKLSNEKNFQYNTSGKVNGDVTVQPFSILPPYKAVAIWERVADTTGKDYEDLGGGEIYDG